MYHRILHPLSLYHFCVRYSKLVPVISAVPRKEGIRILVSGHHREVDENCALLGHYAGCSGNSFPTFWDNIYVPSSRV